MYLLRKRNPVDFPMKNFFYKNENFKCIPETENIVKNNSFIIQELTHQLKKFVSARKNDTNILNGSFDILHVSEIGN
jgi:hypothetical protein